MRERTIGDGHRRAWYHRSMQVPEGYIAFVEELPGANTQGDTLEEARMNPEESVTMVLDTNREMSEQSLAGADVIRESLILPAA